ncbi:testicular acid phosphatase homolog, partial [Orbicella faveolata]|uniref:testicular acid phosphatase homolog n=1 Tax=Orbicella faveolata TaxID=48498 RepID=UPI0009E3EB01
YGCANIFTQRGEVKIGFLSRQVYRHGDRSPTHIYPNDPYQEDVWPQGIGMLTQKGMRGEYALGKFLKSRYVEGYKLFNATYILKEVREFSSSLRVNIYIRSSDYDRTLMSAQTQLNGLYPPKGHQIWRDNLDWQPIGIHVVPLEDDYVSFFLYMFIVALSINSNQFS